MAVGAARQATGEKWYSNPADLRALVKAAEEPYHFGMVDAHLFAFGGIWEYWARGEAPPRLTCAIVVTRANELVAKIHDRMPVIIAPEDYAQWLDPGASDMTSIAGMLEPYPAEFMRGYPIATRVNNVKNEGPDLLEPSTPGAFP